MRMSDIYFQGNFANHYLSPNPPIHLSPESRMRDLYFELNLANHFLSPLPLFTLFTLFRVPVQLFIRTVHAHPALVNLASSVCRTESIAKSQFLKFQINSNSQYSNSPLQLLPFSPFLSTCAIIHTHVSSWKKSTGFIEAKMIWNGQLYPEPAHT